MKGLITLIFIVSLAFANNGDLEKAKKFIEENKLKEARSILEKIIETDEKNPEAFYYLAIICTKNKNMDDAEDYCEEAVEICDTVAKYHFLLGQIYGIKVQNASVFRQAFLAGDVLDEFKKTVELDSTHIGGRIGMLQYYSQAPGIVGGDMNKAFEQAREIIKLDTITGYNHLIDLLIKENKYIEATGYIEKLIKNDEITGRFKNISLFLAQSKINQALNEFKIIDTKFGDNPEIKKYKSFFNTLGYALLKKDKLLEAIDVFKKQVEIAPDDPNAFDSLGDGYKAAGKFKKAAEAYKKALEIDPDFKASKNNLEELQNKL